MAENVDNSRKAMAPEGWERHRHLGSCPAGQGCRGGPLLFLEQEGWAREPGQRPQDCLVQLPGQQGPVEGAQA